MIEFLLVFMIDERIIDRTQRFQDLNRCIYFAQRLTDQPNVPNKDGNPGVITAYCKPVKKN